MYESSTYKLLQTAIVNVRWNNLDVGTALSDLTRQTRTAMPQIEFLLQLPANTKLNRHGIPIHREVHILLLPASVAEVLDYVCQQTNLVLEIEGEKVILTP